LNRKRRRQIAAGAGALLTIIAAAACGSASSQGGAGDSTQAAPATIKIGLLTDLTGIYSSAYTTAAEGINAYVTMVNDDGGIDGHKLSYVAADTASTPTGAETAAQVLVQRDNVFAVVADSGVTFGAEPYLLRQGVPLVGAPLDGPEWDSPKNTNMFASTGTMDLNSVSSAPGEFMKAHGVTSCAAIGDQNSASAASATADVESCVAAGLKNGYVNSQQAGGSTDVGAIALAIKKAGVNGVDVPAAPSTGFALLAALKQLGVNLKVLLLDTGYGGDLLASSASVQAGQGVMFASQGQPAELNTPATQKMAAALAKVGVTGPPTFAEQVSYISMAAVAAGLKAAGQAPTQKSFMGALRTIDNFSADGLLSPGAVNFSEYNQAGAGSVAAGCVFAAQLEGSKFVPLAPVCGRKISGLTTSG
jgi:branched-chain amino acid transport system substrate-binding protein